MPANLIKAYATKLKRKESELEKVWDEAKEISLKKGLKDNTESFYKYTTTVFQRMLGLEDEDTVPMDLHKITAKVKSKVNEVFTSFEEFCSINEDKIPIELINSQRVSTKALYHALDEIDNTMSSIVKKGFMKDSAIFAEFIDIRHKVSNWNKQLMENDSFFNKH